MRFLKKIRNLLFIFVLFGAVTAFYDYTNILKGNSPIFCIEQYNDKSKTEKFRGIFYIIERKVKQSPKEKMNLSNDITYKFLTKTIAIQLDRPKDQYQYTLLVTPATECLSNVMLYTELENKKIYLDCITSIRLKEKGKKNSKDLKEVLEKNPNQMEDILKNISYVGLEKDQTTEKYRSLDDTFVNREIIVYRCNNEEEDIYITNNNKEQNYCMAKEDVIKQQEQNSQLLAE